MSLLPNWLNSDLFSVLRDKYNNLNSSYNGLAGGSTDQILAKNSNGDFDYKWISSGASIPDPAGHDGESLQSDGSGLVYGFPATITDGTYNIAYKVVPIGDWNMNSSPTKNVAHGIADWTKILFTQVIIVNDVNTKRYIFTQFGESGLSESGTQEINSTNVVLFRVNSGSGGSTDFDSTNFDSTAYNRGYVTIWYMV